MQVKAKLYLFLIPITLFLFFDGCKKDLTPADNTQPKIQLTVEDVGVTEAWLQLTLQNPNSKNQITITRDTVTLKHFNTLTHDTLIYDSGLLPNHDYTYTATSTGSASGGLLSEVEITTMDTTSHDFIWQSWTFGAQGSSILYDVAIIDDNNIWAVGEIYTEDTYTYDSLGNWIQPYNAVHWNGSKWELERILYQGGFWTIETIYAFNENDISFEYAVRWNGVEFEEQPIPGILIGQSFKKMWGTSSEDLYVVGDNGLIAYYNGKTWQRIESGTQNNLHDIWGIHNQETDEKTILVSARNKILKITNDNVVEEFDWPFSQNGNLSLWFKNGYTKFTCGDGVFKYRKTIGWKMFSELLNYKTYHIRGNDINDVFVAGSFGYAAHYNGITWKDILPTQNVRFGSMSTANNLTAIVGYDFNSSPVKAIITILTKN